MKPEKKKKTLNKIITQTYQSRWSSWKPSRKARIAGEFSTFLYPSSKVKKENDAIRNRIADDFDKRRISQPKTLWKKKKTVSDNRRIMITAVFRFVHLVEKDE